MNKEKLEKEVQKLREIIMEASLQLAEVEKILNEEKEPNKPSENDLKKAEDILIEELGFSERVNNPLKKFGVINLKQLYEYFQNNSVHLRGIGDKGLKEINAVLSNLKQTVKIVNQRRRRIKTENRKLSEFSSLSEETVNYLNKREITDLEQLYYYAGFKKYWKDVVKRETRELLAKYY